MSELAYVVAWHSKNEPLIRGVGALMMKYKIAKAEARRLNEQDEKTHYFATFVGSETHKLYSASEAGHAEAEA